MTERSSKKYITAHEKAVFVLKKILEKAPISVAKLTELMMKERGARFSTARSSISQVVKDLLELGVLEYIGSGKRGTKIVDLSPKGLITILNLLMMIKENKIGITLDDLLNYLARKGYDRYVPLITLYTKINSEFAEEELEEKEIEAIKENILDYFYYTALLEDMDYPESWQKLEEYIIEEILEILDEALIETPSKILDLKDLVNRLNENEKRILKKVLYEFKTDKEIEIERIKKIVGELNELLKHI